VVKKTIVHMPHGDFTSGIDWSLFLKRLVYNLYCTKKNEKGDGGADNQGGSMAKEAGDTNYSISDGDVIGRALNEKFIKKALVKIQQMIKMVVHRLRYVIEKAPVTKKVNWTEVTLKIRNIMSMELGNPSFFLTFCCFNQWSAFKNC